MGGFINSQSDNEICEVLNKRFSDDVNANGQTYLDELRQFFRNKEKLFSNSHKLNRIFHRLAISVTGGASVPKTKNSRLRWFHLLKGNLPAAVDQAIRGQLTAILSPASPGNPAGGAEYVTFSTVHQPTTTGDQFELFDAKHRAGSRACRPSVFLGRKKRKPLSASLWSSLSWSFSYRRKKTHLGDSGFVRCSQLRSIAKSRLGRRTPDSC